MIRLIIVAQSERSSRRVKGGFSWNRTEKRTLASLKYGVMVSGAHYPPKYWSPRKLKFNQQSKSCVPIYRGI